MAISPFALGATLYMPATREDLLDVAVNNKIENLRSLVICLEDAVSELDVDQAKANLQGLLQSLERMDKTQENRPLLFVRPRNAEMACALNDWDLINQVDGFVLPKFNLHALGDWMKAVSNPHLLMMPTLETAEVFDPVAMVDLRDAMTATLQERIIALRIGGNDLLGCLGLRRSTQRTSYSTPLGYCIPMLCGVMGAAGFSLTAPVFERLDNDELLKEELDIDICHGLVGKTAIHPRQIHIIQESFRVSVEDLNSAKMILCENAAAVFQHGGAMCEPATHHQWATSILERAKWHGVRSETPVVCSSEVAVRVTGTH